MFPILQRGYGVSEGTWRDMSLIAEALADQSRRLASRARSKAYAGPAMAIARATLRERSDTLAWLARDLDPHEPVLVRCADYDP
jgi:hypothetical protein